MALAVQSDRVAQATNDVGQTVLSEVRALAGQLKPRAAEFEAARRMAPDVVEQLKQIGVFRMYAPRSFGGLELDFPITMEILAELARIDGSVGWVAMIGAGSVPFMSKLPRPTFDRLFAEHGPDMIVAGSAQPAGRAEQVEGGYRVSGRWPFASGCQHADVIFSGVVVTKDGAPVPGRTPGLPMIRHIVLDAGDWTIEDTWRVAGLKGTGSHHIALKDHFVAEAQILDFGGPSCIEGPLYSAPLQLVPLMHGAPAIGIAEGAIDDLVALASTGKTQFAMATAMKDSQLFQAELGRIEADVRAARALQEARIQEVWARLLAGDFGPPTERVTASQAAAWVTTTCVRAGDALYALGGGSALYDESPLQRRLRDLHAAAQHAAVQPRHYLAAGAVRLGHPPPPSPFG
jgi:alkylation response protein AidB-like acyl-CoA dehydrogenase